MGVFLLFSSAGVLDSPRTVGILSFSMTSVGSGVSLDSPATVGVFGFGEVGVDGVDGTGFTGLAGVTGEGGYTDSDREDSAPAVWLSSYL